MSRGELCPGGADVCWRRALPGRSYPAGSDTVSVNGPADTLRVRRQSRRRRLMGQSQERTPPDGLVVLPDPHNIGGTRHARMLLRMLPASWLG